MLESKIQLMNLWSYVRKVIVIFVTMIGLFYLFADSGSAISSFVNESITFGVSTIFASYIIFKDIRLVRFFCIAYFLKLCIGVAHYLVFIDPTYFYGNGTQNLMHHEFQAVAQFLNVVSEEKKALGVLHFKLDGWVTHQELLSIIAIPLRFFGVKMLAIAPINSFFSLFAAMNVFYISQHLFYNKKSKKLLLVMLAFFPATLLTSYFFRDVVGLGFMSIGLVMICLSRNFYEKVVSMFVAMFCFYLQRNGYIVIPIILLCVDYSLMSKQKNPFLIIISCIIALIVLPFAVGYSSNSSTDEYISASTKWPIYLLPVKIVFGLIGPFPWSNFATYRLLPYVAYYLGDYIMGILNIGLLLCVINFRQSLFKKNNFTLVSIVGFILLSMGVMNEYMHMTYISIGIFFLIPWITRVVPSLIVKRYILYAFCVLVFLNMIVFLFDFSGMSSTVK